MNFVIALQKDVALISFIGPVEILRQAGVHKSQMANFTPYVGAANIFLCLTIPATRYADYLLAKQRPYVKNRGQKKPGSGLAMQHDVALQDLIII